MSDPPSKLAAFITELKQRRVFRVAAVYACVSFIIIQIIDGAFDYLRIPEWIGTTIIVLLALGFFIAVGMAWAFDLTEEGLVRTKPKREPTMAKAQHHPLVGNKVLALIAAMAVAVAVWSWWGRPSAAGAITSIAVLPLENLMNDPEQDYFVDGMHDALISELGKISALRVIGRTSVLGYRDAPKPIPEIAQELKVDAVVEGSVLLVSGEVKITAQLVAASPERHLWTDSYTRSVSNVLSLHSEVARAIAKEIGLALTPAEETRLASVRAINPEAYEAYLKGRYYWNKRTEEGLKTGLKYFEQAIEKDPGYALAYAGLADSYVVLVDWSFFPPKEAHPKARAAAMRALEIESTLAEARTALAWVRYKYDWNWLEAERGFKRALELNPNYATGYQWYAEFLMAMGRFDEALVEIRRAQELDPLSLIISAIKGYILYYARQYDLAIEQCRKTLEMDPNFVPAHLYLLWCYAQKGMDEEAIAEYQILQELIGKVALLNYVAVVPMERSELRKALDELIKLSQQIYVPPTSIALIYVSLDEKDQAFQWLEKAYEERDMRMPFLKVWPGFDPLRDDPRFQDLLQRMNFPE